ncbi:MFS transporter [Salinisphaera sp. G21_0]|uniref:MFS transporter n=1 Tax=Salinisphaera sp. G21_0 TaxID=2821094 RepID=UPI001ADA7FC3|nr:MFS transporter [Salinisphaera sp. G21_0]MBO9493698.1 MFS transporter [Thalassotalea sp. G20_0]
MIAVFLLGTGQTTLLISLPAILEETGIGYGVLSVMVALGTGLFILSAPIWGRISDNYGRIPVIISGTVGIALSFLMLALSIQGVVSGVLNQQQAIFLMFSARIIYGLLASGLYPAVQAWVIDDSARVNRARMLSRITAGINVGRLSGPLVPALLIGWGSAFPLGAVSLLAMVFLIMLVILPVVSVRHDKVSGGRNGYVRLLMAETWPLLLLACSVTTLFGFLQYLAGPRLHLIVHDGVTTTRLLSILMMLAALSTIIAHLVAARWVQRNLVMALKCGSVLLLIGTMFMVTGKNLFWLASGMTISAASVALLTPAYTALASAQASRQQGALTGMLTMIHTIGYTLGALLAGTINSNGWQQELVGVLVASVSLMITFLWVDHEHGKSLCLRFK